MYAPCFHVHFVELCLAVSRKHILSAEEEHGVER